MTRKRSTSWLPRLALLISAFAQWSCTEPPEQPVVLVAVYNQTGAQSGLDVPSALGARLAVDEANAAGGVLGRTVHLVMVDGETDPTVISERIDVALAGAPRPAAIFGLSDTDMVLAAAPVAAEHETVFVTSGATSPLLPGEVPEFLFLACFGDNVQAAAGAEWAVGELGASTAVVLFDESTTYTRLLQRYFMQSFEAQGGEILATVEFHSADLSELPTADLIYLSSGPDDAPTVAQALRSAGVETPILGGDGLDVPEAWKSLPEIAGVFYTTHADLRPNSTAPGVDAFRSAYSAANAGTETSAQPDAFAALGYDTARLLLQAIEDAGSDDLTAVRQALASVSDFEGVTGRLSYPDGERIPHKSVTLVEIREGQVASTRQILPQRVPAPGSDRESLPAP